MYHRRNCSVFTLIFFLFFSLNTVFAANSETVFIIDGSFTHNSDTVGTTINLAQRIEGKATLRCTLTHFNFPLESKIIAEIIYREQFSTPPSVIDGFGHHTQTGKEEFKRHYSLWPDFFGFPEGDSRRQEKAWYPLHSASWKENYPDDFKSLPCETELVQRPIDGEQAINALIAQAGLHSPQNKLVYIGLGPLHNLASALKKEPDIAKNIKLYTMGGATPLGYNWNIAPEITDYVLKSGIETIVITSDLIRDQKLNVTTFEFELMQLAQFRTKLGKALWQELYNWYFKGDVLKNDKNLCNPFTLWCFLKADKITQLSPISVTFHCLDDNGQLKKAFSDTPYNDKTKVKEIMTITPVEKSHISMVKSIADFEEARREMVYDLFTVFYPGISQEDFFGVVYDTDKNAEEIAARLNKMVPRPSKGVESNH